MDTPTVCPVARPRDDEPLSPGTHSFRLGGIVQRYHVHGSGPVCVAHPGGPGLFWDYLRVPALETHLTMVYVEPIGTGESGCLPSHPHGYTRDRYSHFLQVLINRLRCSRVYLLGHAHGALVAAHHALHRSESLAGVILYDAEPSSGRADRAPTPPAGDSDVDPGGWSSATAGVHRRAAYISGLDENLCRTTGVDRADLARMDVRTLVISGREDPVRGAARGRGLHEVIPGARLSVLEHDGCMGHVQEPEGFTHAVREFVLDAEVCAPAR
ncbi:alpha/beta hydrolase [Streptomyces sp. NPDC007074]|uniref:alpha/beta fold hydrolase n=1 Tax=Streptomyces sp. NPDC007074 TaxID=3156764 RepID=UPI0033EAEC10